MARPTLLTPELAESIVRLVEVGNYPTVAARFYGIADSTVSEWIARGSDPDHPRNVGTKADDVYREFAERIMQADARSEVMAVVSVYQAAQTDPDHAMRFLERRHPKHWRSSAQVSLTGDAEQPIAFMVEVRAPDYIEQVNAKLAEAGVVPRLVGSDDTTG